MLIFKYFSRANLLKNFLFFSFFPHSRGASFYSAQSFFFFLLAIVPDTPLCSLCLRLFLPPRRGLFSTSDRRLAAIQCRVVAHSLRRWTSIALLRIFHFRLVRDLSSFSRDSSDNLEKQKKKKRRQPSVASPVVPWKLSTMIYSFFNKSRLNI